MATRKRQCPECSITLTRFEWSRLWWLSAGMSGRLVHPCSGCGRLLQLSAMHAVTAIGALGMIASSIARFISESNVTLALALVCAVMILVGTISTRIEVVRQIEESAGRPARPFGPPDGQPREAADTSSAVAAFEKDAG